MDITSPPEFREQPVIDIYIEFAHKEGSMGWTINDTPEARFVSDQYATVFFVKETAEEIRFLQQNCAYSSIRRRIDRIPVKTERGTSPASSQQPEGGEAGN